MEVFGSYSVSRRKLEGLSQLLLSDSGGFVDGTAGSPLSDRSRREPSVFF